MNQFEQHLTAARRRQRRIYLGGVLAALAGTLIVAAILMATRATLIEIQPQEVQEQAKISVISGLAILTGQSLYTLSGKPVVSVEAEGFYTSKRQISEADFGNVLVISLKPLPAKLHLYSPVSDNRTRWSINEEFIAQGDELERELEPGDYLIGISHPYYEMKELQLSLGRGERLDKKVELELVKGEVKINTRPQAASLSIDDVEKGSTPVSLPLQGGEYTLRVHKQAYEPVVETLEITRDAALIERDYRLEPEKGTVKVSLNPAGGKLLINRLEVKPASSYRLAVNQTHSMSYSKPGYFSQSRSFRVSTEKPAEIGFKLEKEIGQVEIDATPAAEVSVNGEAVGSTPLTLELDALPQEIVFTKPGYRTVVKKVLPNSKSVKSVKANLIPERLARLQAAPSSYRHKAGGEMKLYRPAETFTMGAERSEPGQRVNEFVYQVSLKRPFYAGVKEVSYAVYQQFDKGVTGNASLPVTSISWSDAARFCNWLSDQESLQAVYRLRGNSVSAANADADGYRLLSEAEWEWLARKAGRKQRTRFVWGDDEIIPPNSANIADASASAQVKNTLSNYNDGHAGVAAVGSFNQELSGLHDQGGNVSEWVHDNYSLQPPNTGHVHDDVLDEDLIDSHVIKGASWRSGSLTETRASYRQGAAQARDDVGFRIGRYVYGGE